MTALLLGLAGVFVDAETAIALRSEGAAFVDARGKDEWRDGHVPGSAPVAWTSLRDGLLRTGRLTEDLGELQRALSAAGVRDDAPVVVVGAAEAGWGEEGRILWMLEYLGHPDAHVLDGGWDAWVAGGGPTAEGSEDTAPGAFTPRPDEARRARLDEVVARVEACAAGPCDTVLWDTRSRREYDGATPYLEPRGGHLPGAVHLHYLDLMGPDGRLLPEDDLRSLLAARGIAPDKEVIAYCTGGVRSGFAYAVLRQLGYPRAANYDGSTWEWTSERERPVE